MPSAFIRSIISIETGTNLSFGSGRGGSRGWGGNLSNISSTFPSKSSNFPSILTNSSAELTAFLSKSTNFPFILENSALCTSSFFSLEPLASTSKTVIPKTSAITSILNKVFLSAIFFSLSLFTGDPQTGLSRINPGISSFVWSFPLNPLQWISASFRDSSRIYSFRFSSSFLKSLARISSFSCPSLDTPFVRCLTEILFIIIIHCTIIYITLYYYVKYQK